jgi:sortase A
MRIRVLIPAGLLALAGWQFGAAAYIHAKARLAQVLLERAWQRTLAGEQAVRPWAWADMHPVARLLATGHDQDLVILDGASGQALAFGPAHVFGTAMPGQRGSAAIVGHRDTHFRFLRELRRGDALEIERRDGARVRYTVTGLRIVDTRVERLSLDADEASLRLITCYPFDAVRPGGPLRFEVIAKPEQNLYVRTSVASRQRKFREQHAESGVQFPTNRVMS